MSEKKFDVSLFLCCLMGGLLGFMASEALYRLVTGGLPLILQAGIYFAVTALLICLSGWLCEMVTGNLRGASWSGREIGLGLLMAVLFTLALGLAGGLFQFIYGLGYQNRTISNIQDYIVLIDNSGSTYETDPNEERYSSVVALAGNLDETHRMMVKIFEDEVTGTFPMTETTPQMQSQLSQFFEQYRRYDTMGGTDIEAALTSAAQEYVPEGRSAAVILLSDGESDVDVNSVAQTYNALGIPIYCVGFSGNGFSGSQLLDLIANSTDGYYCEIDQLSNLSQTVNQMISLSNQRNLLERRRDSAYDSPGSVYHPVRRADGSGDCHDGGFFRPAAAPPAASRPVRPGSGTDYGDRNPDACAGVDPAASPVPSAVRHSSILLENRF